MSELPSPAPVKKSLSRPLIALLVVLVVIVVVAGLTLYQSLTAVLPGIGDLPAPRNASKLELNDVELRGRATDVDTFQVKYAFFTTSDQPYQLEEFYRDSMLKKGWQLDTTRSNETSFTFTKGDQLAQVSLLPYDEALKVADLEKTLPDFKQKGKKGGYLVGLAQGPDKVLSPPGGQLVSISAFQLVS